MNRDNHNRHRRQRATPGFRVSKRPSKSILFSDIVAKRLKTPHVRVTTENGGAGVVYVGPSVEGGDKEYVKVLTGDVDRRKPSFV